MSNTPRTDAIRQRHIAEGEGHIGVQYVQLVQFAEAMERELAEAVALAERLGEGLSYNAPERRAKDLAAFHEWQFNRAK